MDPLAEHGEDRSGNGWTLEAQTDSELSKRYASVVTQYEQQ